MKLSDLLYENEYISSDVEMGIDIEKISIAPGIYDEKTVLIIQSQGHADNLQSAPIPAVTICGAKTVLPDNFPTIRVNNPRLTAAYIYFRFENLSLENIKIIGITGTNGKTSTAFFTKSILTSCGYKVGYIGTGKIEINGKSIEDKYYSMTTPDPPLLYKSLKEMEKAGCQAIVMEVSSHSLALDKVAPIKFDYGVFTNLSAEHLDFHKNEDEYFLAKRKLIAKCNKAIINIDDPAGARLYDEFSQKSISAGVIWRGNVWAGTIERHGISGCSYMYHGKNFSYKAMLCVPGYYNIYNSMLASTVCIDMDIKPCDVKTAVENINHIPGRFEVLKDGVTAIIDYAHTQEAFYNIMKELSQIKADGKLWVVFGCGGERDKGKRPKMAETAEKYADRITVTTDNSRKENPNDIISDIIKGFTSKNYDINLDRAMAIRNAIVKSDENDIVAVIGKGAEGYNIDMSGYSDFNEKEIIKAALDERRRDS